MNKKPANKEKTKKTKQAPCVLSEAVGLKSVEEMMNKPPEFGTEDALLVAKVALNLLH